MNGGMHGKTAEVTATNEREKLNGNGVKAVRQLSD